MEPDTYENDFVLKRTDGYKYIIFRGVVYETRLNFSILIDYVNGNLQPYFALYYFENIDSILQIKSICATKHECIFLRESETINYPEYFV